METQSTSVRSSKSSVSLLIRATRRSSRRFATAIGLVLVVLMAGSAHAESRSSCDSDGDGICTQRDYSAFLACFGQVGGACAGFDFDADGDVGQADYEIYSRSGAVAPRTNALRSDGAGAGAASPSAVGPTIDLYLVVDESPPGDEVRVTVGVENASDQTGVIINGYTLGFDFDELELDLTGIEQLAGFGGQPAAPFAPPNDCLTGTCTAGNTPGQDSGPVGPLFALTFLVTDPVDDALDDFIAGVLDPVFDGITQGTGQPIFVPGDLIVRYAVPEPAAATLTTAAIAAIGLLRRVRKKGVSLVAQSARAHGSLR